MAHSEQMTFFKTVTDLFPQKFAKKVIDIGSLDINGGPHTLFKSDEYVGVDLAAGPNVNLTSQGENVDLPSNYFDVSMSSECFEHNPAWRSTLANMVRMTKPLGLVVISCASTGRLEHGTSRSDGGFAAPLAIQKGQEYYRNLSKRQLLQALDKSQFLTQKAWTNFKTGDLYFVGVKSSEEPSDMETSQEVEALERADIALRLFLKRQNLLAVRAFPRYLYALVYQLFSFSPAYRHFIKLRNFIRRKKSIS